MYMCLICIDGAELRLSWRWVLRPGRTSVIWPPFEKCSTSGGQRLVQACREKDRASPLSEEKERGADWDRELWRRAVAGGCDRLFSGRVCSWKARAERSPVSLCGGLWPIMASRPSSPHSSTMLSASRFVFSLLTLRSLLFAALLHLFTSQ